MKSTKAAKILNKKKEKKITLPLLRKRVQTNLTELNVFLSRVQGNSMSYFVGSSVTRTGERYRNNIFFGVYQLKKPFPSLPTRIMTLCILKCSQH